MWRPLPTASQAERVALPLVGNNFYTNFHTPRARDSYTWHSYARLAWDPYQERTLCIMMHFVRQAQSIAWLPVVISLFDELGTIMRTLESATRASNGRLGPLKVVSMEVQWKNNGTRTIAGMPGDTRTRLYENNLAAVLHMMKQRWGSDSILVTMEDAPIIDLTLEDSTTKAPLGVAGNEGSSSIGKAPRTRSTNTGPIDSSTSDSIQVGGSTGDKSQESVLREGLTTMKLSGNSNNIDRNYSEQRKAAKRKRQISSGSNPTEPSRQANPGPAEESRDRRPDGPVGELSEHDARRNLTAGQSCAPYGFRDAAR